MTSLGRLYENGLGVPRDYGKAREWYEKAAAKEAREQLEKAAAKGDTDAKARLKELGPR